MIRLNKKNIRITKSFFVTFLVLSWLLTGYPAISIPGFGIFPPKIKEVQAAHTLDASAQILDSSTDPVAANYTAGVGTTLLVLSLSSTTTTTRTGGAPTYNGIALTEVATALGDTGGEGTAELWYLLAPPTGASYAVSIPNTNAKPVTAIISSYKAQAGYASAFDATAQASGATTNPSVTVNSTVNGDVCVDSLFNGLTTVPTANNRILLFKNDTGQEVNAAQYYLQPTLGAAAMSYTIAADDWQLVAACFKEVPITTLSLGTDPATITVAPDSGIRDAGAFTVQTSGGTDSITALTVTLAGAGTPYDGLSEVRVTSDNGSTLYFSAISNPASNTLNFSGGTAIQVTTSPIQFKIRVIPKTHVGMPVPGGASYDMSPYISAFTSTNTQAGSDSNANTLTIDNLSPNGATSVSGTAGNAAVTLNWTTSNSGDFDATNGSVVLRWASGTAGGEVPTEGNSSYAPGNTITTATVACVISSSGSTAQSKVDGTGGSAGCTTSALTNGQAYTYKVFQKDTNGNYDAGVSIGTFTPTAASATFTQNKYLWYVDNDLADPTGIWGNPDLIENQEIVVVPSGNDPPDTAQELRLRVNYVVNTAGISISEKYFKLEYKAGTDGTCTTGSWTDVGTGDWVYATSGVTDGADIIKVLSDTTTGKGQEYVKSKPSQANHVAASAAEIIEYDFHIVGTSATANTQYSFRVVETNNLGTTEVVFDGYTSCPTLTTEPGTANLLRHGNVFTEGIEKGFFWN